MPDVSFPIESFGGLNLKVASADAGATSAVAMRNVELRTPGEIVTRDGVTMITGAGLTVPRALGYYVSSAGVETIVTYEASTPQAQAWNLATGATIGTTGTGGAGASNNSFARFGDPSNTRLYLASGGVVRWDGATWTLIAAAPTSTMATVTPQSNRLMLASNTSSKISFSDAGAPETYTANSFIEITPGDGDIFTGLIRWRDYVFIFKETKFAVYTR